MSSPVFISANVLNTLRSLPETERINIASALVCNLILGCESIDSLTGTEAMIYTMLNVNVQRDTRRFLEGTAASA